MAATVTGDERGRRLDRIAASQLGLVTAQQLTGLDMSVSQIKHWSEAGRVVALRRGVYRLAGVRMTWEREVLAAVLASQDRAVASHGTAARLWGLYDRGDRASVATAVHLSGSRIRLEGVVVHHAGLEGGDRAVRWGVPVTSVPRTLADLAGGLDPVHLGRLTDEALRQRLIDLGQLRRYVQRRAIRADGRRAAGTPALARILADRLPGYDPGANSWELEMDRRWDAWGLPPAERQYEIWTPRGVYRPDRAIVAERIAVDWNGFEYHGMRSRFDADSDRRADLAVAGWAALDFTSHSSAERICETVHAVWLERSGRRAG